MVDQTILIANTKSLWLFPVARQRKVIKSRSSGDTGSWHEFSFDILSRNRFIKWSNLPVDILAYLEEKKRKT